MHASAIFQSQVGSGLTLLMACLSLLCLEQVRISKIHPRRAKIVLLAIGAALGFTILAFTGTETPRSRLWYFGYLLGCVSANAVFLLIGAVAATHAQRFTWPRCWELLQYILPKKIRQSVYEPAHNDLLEDYLLTNRKYRTKWARQWLTFCFFVRTAVLVADCLRVAMTTKVMQMAAGMIKVWWNT